MADDDTREPRPTKISNGPNARPRDATIAQTGPGLPNDTSSPVEIDEEEARRIEEKIRSL
ncbi:hypothetical protein [Methylobacterium nonmethylotrophicum]|uniref:Uncharacterized protein n=1 Tax=Methylobacterium nonmethylotrophicum TaxID=1141884 RepID=A0A4Z0NKV6_9HYPH|nr:hypothetical protein [Methylobacterium nonmethylotrophicum]TGD96769.1 hypothetical protein EU555_22185 [Methylobacterium nonmethylotrophicum]